MKLTNDQDHGGRENEPTIKPDAAEPYRASICSSDGAEMTRRNAIAGAVALLALPSMPPMPVIGLPMNAYHWRRYTAYTVTIDVHSGVAKMVLMKIVPMLDVQPRSASPSEVPRSQPPEDLWTIHIYGKRSQLHDLDCFQSQRLQCILDSLHIAPPSTSTVVLHTMRHESQTYCAEAKDRT